MNAGLLTGWKHSEWSTSLLVLGTRCGLGANPIIDRLYFVLAASRLMEYLTAVADAKLETRDSRVEVALSTD